MKFKRTVAVIVASLIFYVSSFLAFRAFPYTFDLVPPNEPGHHLVLFSFNTNLHCAARVFYSPLIAMFPGNRYYPTRAEHKLLMDAQAESEKWEVTIPVDEQEE